MTSNWSRLTRTIAPTVPAITVATAKAHLRVEHTEDDGQIEALIEVATAALEGPDGIGVALINQTWRIAFDGYLPTPVELPLGPVQAVTGITYVDPDHATQTLDPALYRLLTDRRPAVVERVGDSWPAMRRQLGTAAITFTAGFGATAASVPADLRAAMLLMVGHLYAHREAVDRAMQELPLGYSAIVERHRVGRFG
jgi:uncharacterized phiE125 gp8 family phage protein